MKYFLIALLFVACKNVSKQRKIATEPLDTIKTAAPNVEAKPFLFETAFVKGTTDKVNPKRIRVKNATSSFYGVNIGNVKFPSGRIIACDPLHIDEYGIPFTQVFPTGEFPVQLSIARLDDEEIVAFARVSFSDEPVKKWELALQKGQSPVPLDGEKIHGYGVDAGIGLFMDEVAAKAMDEKKLSELPGELYKELDQHYRRSWQYTLHKLGNNNLASFTTGFGDGRYATYIGFDAAGKPCRLVTDFGIFDWKMK